MQVKSKDLKKILGLQYDTFFSCKSLKIINAHKLKKIEAGCFYDCKKLQTINSKLDKNN